MNNYLIASAIVVFIGTFCGAQIELPSLPQGVPMPPGTAEAPAALPPAAPGPPAGPPAPVGGRVQPRVRPQTPTGSLPPSPVDVGNPSVSVCKGFGWTINDGNCYKVVEGLMNMNQAQAACRAEDPKAHLVVIENETDNRFIGRMIAGSIARSLKTYHLATTLFNTCWIGLRRVKIGDNYESTWITGVPATFGNEPGVYTLATLPKRYPWSGDQPSGTNKYTDPTGAPEPCVHMFNADGLWNDVDCGVQMTCGICQKDAEF